MSNRNELDKYTNVLLIPSTLVFYVLGHTNYLLYQLRLFSISNALAFDKMPRLFFFSASNANFEDV